MDGMGPDVKLLVEAFRELDIATGNGLIGDAQLLEPAKRALFIGLGGTGNHALRRLKRIIHQRYDHIDRNFAFIGIDTDTSNPHADKDYMPLTRDEKIELTAGEDFFDPRKRDLMPDYIRTWLNDSTVHTVRGDGAGGKRAAARALLFNSSVRVINKISGDLTRIRTGDENTRIDTFILAGIGGGTGSGTLVDIAYILRGLLKNVRHSIHAFIFMPDINTSIPLPSGTKEYIPANAFAALKEIDYWMNIEARGDVYIQQYSNSFKVEEMEPPFNYCWPMTATNSNGLLVVDALNQACTVAAEVICAWIAFRESKEADAATNTFLQSFAANAPLERDVYRNGLLGSREGISLPVSFDYLVCGASVAKLPISAINTYLACILFSRFGKLYERGFDDRIVSELPKFCSDKTVAIEFNQIKQSLESKLNAIGARLPDMSDRSWGDLFENDAERDYIYVLGQITANVEAVKKQIVSEKIQSMNMAFKEIFLDSKQGPYYLSAFIQNGNSGLIAMLESFKRIVKIEQGRLENVERDLEREKNDAYRNGRKAIFIMRGGHVREYSGALSRFYMNGRDKLLCDACMGIYAELQDQLSKRVSASYRASFSILEALCATFKNNIDTFNNAVKVEQRKNVVQYSWDIFTLPEIVGLVMRTLSERGFDETRQEALVKDFLARLLNLIEREIKRYEAVGDLNDVTLQGVDVNRFLANFIADKFDFLTKRTLSEYLEAIAKEKGQTLQEYLVAQFQNMERDASPLFATHPAGASKLYYSAIPVRGVSDIAEAWEKYAAGDEHRKAFPSDNGETLAFMTIGVGTPLYAAKQLESAEEAYNRHMNDHNIASSLRLVSATRLSAKLGHKDMHWDWRNLPSPIPSDARPESSVRTRDRDWESSCRVDVNRLMDKKLLRGNETTGKCSFLRLVSADYKKIMETILPEKITPNLSASKLREAKSKLADLISYLDGTAPIAQNLVERFGMFFEIVVSEFQAALHNDWKDPLHEVVAVFSRAINVRRDLEKTEEFYDALVGKIGEIDAILNEMSASLAFSEQLVKGFLCGLLSTNGKQWLYVDEDGETQVLARLGDRYPFFSMCEKIAKMPGRDELLARIDAAYAAALDGDTLETESYGLFKELFKKERKKMDEDENIGDSQRYLADRVNRYIADIGL